MPIGTGAIGISPDGEVQVYVPPNVLIVEPPIPDGYNVVYGAPQAIADGDPLPTGTWQVQSGTLVADGAVQVRSVTITPL